LFLKKIPKCTRAKIFKIKIVLFDLVEHELILYPDRNKIRSIEKNMQFYKHPSPIYGHTGTRP
jgi:hypothetical protein